CVRSPPFRSWLQRSRMFVAQHPPAINRTQTGVRHRILRCADFSGCYGAGSRGAECLLCPQPSIPLPAPEEPNVCSVPSPPSRLQRSRMFVVSAALHPPPGSRGAECLLCPQPSIPLPAPEEPNVCCVRSPPSSSRLQRSRMFVAQHPPPINRTQTGARHRILRCADFSGCYAAASRGAECF